MEDKKHCIVTEDDVILEKDLTMNEAEKALTYFLNRGEDCYIGETEAYQTQLNERGEPTPI